MVNRIPFKLLVLLALLTFCIGESFAEKTKTLVSYNFDDQQIETGPDTFRTYENSRGKVGISHDFSISGYTSIKIQEVANDKDFPELQGYFQTQDKGILNFKFSLMTTTENETFNIALAGPQWFGLRKNGIGFWLKSKDRYFYHISDSIPKRLAPIMPFTWYNITLDYNISTGTYDLRIAQEGLDELLIDLKAVKNASNQANSQINKFSFIGDLRDQSNAVYFIDDITIKSSEELDIKEYIAPGRRKLFIDHWHDSQHMIRKKPVCLQVNSLTDFGISTNELRSLRKNKKLEDLFEIFHASSSALKTKNLDKLKLQEPIIWAATKWRLGCINLKNNQPQKALSHFDDAIQNLPYTNSKLLRLSRILALAALNEQELVDSEIYSLYSEWATDQRFAIFLAIVGLTRNDLESAEDILFQALQNQTDPTITNLQIHIWSDIPRANSLTPQLNAEHQSLWKSNLQKRMLIEQYYFVLLWQQSYEKAETYAGKVKSYLESENLPFGKWLEYQGNAAFLNGKHSLASNYYKQGIAANIISNKNSLTIALKLSDIAFIDNDLKSERYYRELVYGSIKDIL